jgi:hypothetical protein
VGVLESLEIIDAENSKKRRLGRGITLTRLWFFPHDNQHAPNETFFEGVSEEVGGIIWQCEPDCMVVECNQEANVGSWPVEWHGVKNPSPVPEGE